MTKTTATTHADHAEHAHNEVHEEDLGLVYDIRTLIGRRAALGLFGGVATATLLAACSATVDAAPTATPSTSTPEPSASAAAAPTTEVPDETAGPYPGDGSNGVNVLDDSGIVRSDIRSSFGSSTTTAEGVPLTIKLTVREAATGNVLEGAAVYLWHCTRDGAYSLYGRGLENENFLRGVQQVDSTGTATFTSIFPGAYSGRWPHIHFEVYSDVATAVASGPSSRPPRSLCPRRRARPSTRRPDTSRACATSVSRASPQTTCSVTTAAFTRSQRCPVRRRRDTRRRSRSGCDLAGDPHRRERRDLRLTVVPR